ncbi:MAG: bile acid:sodium symporter, partial [Actinobacteria bacterium]|nr:bile acid:sodium symporter [Actinomycetota bacterium]
MNDSALISVGLPIALAIIMFGLGLSLTVGDFRRVARTPRAVAVALVLQVLVLPVIAFGLVLAFDLDPLLAVGVMLLAASPGGTTANLFSHLFHGDVALNITLTAINSVLAALTIPFITNFAIGYFDADGELGLQVGKVLQVIAIVLVPVAIGMVVRARSAELARRADRPVRAFSIAVLVIVAV